MKKKLILLLCLFVCAATVFAQDRSVTMADELRSNGKIYTVVAVVLLILIGLFLYLIRLDTKISRLEKNYSSKS